MTPQFSLILAAWGALISTALALIKINEFYGDRPRIVTSYSFGSDPETGNEIILQNPTKTPVMVTYWEVLLKKARGIFSALENVQRPISQRRLLQYNCRCPRASHLEIRRR